MPYRPAKRRRAIIWLDLANWPTHWTLEWYLDGDVHTELGGNVALGVDVARLVALLDQLPESVSPSAIDLCEWAANDHPICGDHRIKVDLPGWKETQSGATWYLPRQLPLPLS